MYYYRRMRDYYEGLNRAPIAAQHPAPAQSLPAEVPAPTQHVQALHQAHLLPDGMDGFAQNWTRKKPTKHTQVGWRCFQACARGVEVLPRHVIEGSS